MITLTLNDFNINKGLLSKSLKDEEFVLITDDNNAIGLLSVFSDDLFKYGFSQWIGIKAYQTGDLTLRQLASLLKTNVDSTMKMLNNLNIPVIDYNFEDDLETLNKL